MTPAETQTLSAEAVAELRRRCPFCGNSTRVHIRPHDEAGLDYGFEVRCDASGFEDDPRRGCGATSGWGETPEEAAHKWNARAEALPRALARVAELEAEVARLRDRCVAAAIDAISHQQLALLDGRPAARREFAADQLQTTKTLVVKAIRAALSTPPAGDSMREVKG